MTGTAGLVLDLAGTFAFALNGAPTAVRAVRLDIVGVVTLGVITALGGGILRDVLLSTITAVGGGTVRDVLVRRVPSVLRSELYAIPALLGAAVVVVAIRLGADGVLWALVAAAVACTVRLLGVGLGPQAPRPPGAATQARDPEA